MKVVIDTNVLISGLINSAGYPGRIIDLVRSGVLVAVVDDRMLDEYGDVLQREYFRKYFSKQDGEDIFDFFRKDAYRTTSHRIILDLPDPGDAPFLEVALSEEVPLITGNEQHYPINKRDNCRILNPEEFLRIFFT